MFVCGRVLLKYKKRQKNSDTDIRRGTESTPLQFFKFHEVPCKGMVLYRSLDDFTEKAVAPYSSTLAWKIPWMEEPGGLPSMGSHRVEHDWSDLAAADDFNFAFQEITVQQLMAHLDSIRKDMVILEKSEFANLRAENQVIQVSIN